jgi:LacI family transcriptional regulator
MKNQRATVKDIAKYVGVSATTVSNVLNKRDGRVSDDIINKVNQAVIALHYKKNYSALSLVSNKSNLIGVIIPQVEAKKNIMLDNPFYAEFIGDLEYKLREAGYHMILSGVGNDDLDISYLESWNLDGIILVGAYEAGAYKALKQLDIPIVLVDSYVNDDYFYKVRIDDELGGYIATKYLLDKGHRNIGLVTGEILKEGVAEKRYMGYRRALKEYNVEFKNEWLLEKEVSFEWGYEAGKKIAKESFGITALFAIADIMATGLISAFHEEKVSVPEEISIIGFDDVMLAKIATPPLTTVNQNIHKKAKVSANVMLSILNGSVPEVHNVLLDIAVVERMSVKEV